MVKRKNILSDIHPSSLLIPNTVVQTFDNKEDFQYYLKNNKHKSHDTTRFFKNVQKYKVDEKKVEAIRNTVRNNLIKRGIITGTVYEGYKYDIEGEIIDYGELATGNPRCFRKPIKKYDKWFYELYVNMSIPWFVSEESIIDGAIRLTETIKALEELNVEIKVNIILHSDGMFTNGGNYLFVLPLCSHLEFKDHDLLLPYMDGEFLRQALFTVMKNNGKTSGDLGSARKLKNSVNLWELEEEELARGIMVELGI